jgi:hypothetical protein
LSWPPHIRNRLRLIEVHSAAPPLGPVQTCMACWRIIQDNRPWYEGRVAVPPGQDDRGPSWWPAGALVGKSHGMTYLVEGRPLHTPLERLCNGAN